MKHLKVATIVLVVLALFLSLNLMTASAAGISPLAAPYVDNGTHAIDPSGTQWYNFDYAGNNSLVTLRMIGAAGTGMKFAVYTPGQIADWWDEEPVGRGSPEINDLVWSGAMPAAGTYSVKVDNSNGYMTNFQLTIAGSGVSVTPKVAPPVVQPLGPDPLSAPMLDSGSHVIAANATLWHRFVFPGDSQMTIRLPNGKASGLEFKVYDTNSIATWWKADPMGVGSPVGDDLVWMGSAPNGEMVYVEVVNANPYALSFSLSTLTENLIE